MIVQIYGADLVVRTGDGDKDTSANLKFQTWWSGKPDCFVKFRHGDQRGETQVGGRAGGPPRRASRT